MSRQELLSWASILSSVAFIGFYLVAMFGIPSVIAPIGKTVVQVFIWIVIVDLVIQAIISAQKKKPGRVQRDERDDKIEAAGFRVAYHVFVVAVVILIGHLFIQKMMGGVAETDYVEIMSDMPLHYLVMVFFIGTASKSVTQVLMYRREA